MELNYQNVDNRGFNSNFNPDQSLDLPYSPKSRNKVNANKSHYEEERRPGAIVDKNAAYFANLRKVNICF